jgi:hypothetical protein
MRSTRSRDSRPTRVHGMGNDRCLRILGRHWQANRAMNFTVVRAVRGSDLSPGRPAEGLRGASLLPPSPGTPAPMDLPYAEEVLHLELSDFPKTIPGRLE